ncbi:hypothetical protein Thimo_3056 [Thioflavicoccus mobilis 8321]|uniref:Uncharacterized protein n=1 Tax=Thioflavicoccus mobilis 8321 TaxID=765912 RepID=L0H2C6_9GAMM|nr:hypothetical protein Thimo_3056 [Thioflavicoccus mobilis 8321]
MDVMKLAKDVRALAVWGEVVVRERSRGVLYRLGRVRLVP